MGLTLIQKVVIDRALQDVKQGGKDIRVEPLLCDKIIAYINTQGYYCELLVMMDEYTHVTGHLWWKKVYTTPASVCLSVALDKNSFNKREAGR